MRPPSERVTGGTIDYYSYPDIARDESAEGEGRRRRRRAGSSLLWVLLRRQTWWAIGVIVALLIDVGVLLSVARILVAMVDQGIVLQDIPLPQFMPPIIAAAAVGVVFTFLTNFFIQRLQYQVEFDLRTWLYTRIQSADLTRLDAMTSGQLVTRSMSDLTLVQVILGLLPLVLGIVPIILGLGIYLVILNPLMGLTSLLALLINLWLIRKLGPRLRALSWAELNERAEVTTAIDEPVRGIRVVQAFGREEQERAEVADAALRVYRWAMSRARLVARFDLLIKSAPYLVYAVVLFLGARLAAAGG